MGHIFSGTFHQPCLGPPTRVGSSLTLSGSLAFLYRKRSVNVTGQVGGRRYDVSRCAVWELCVPSLASSGMELPSYKRMPSLRGIVPPHPAAGTTRTLQSWIVVPLQIDPVTEMAHLVGPSSSLFCYLLLRKSLHFLESLSPLYQVGSVKPRGGPAIPRAGLRGCGCGHSIQVAGLISKVMRASWRRGWP